MQPSDLPKQKLFARLKTWIHAHPARTYALAGGGLILAAGLTTAAIVWQQPQKVTEHPKPKAVSKTVKPSHFSPLTGEPLANESDAAKPVTAIMIENSPDARPQSGLKQAEVVYEAVAEGGITRFLALYQQNQPQLIGPVRSVRMYYVDWLTPYNASVAHVGGSAAALKVVRSGSYRDIDQFYNASTYWRSSDRRAPHNVYTSFSKINALNTLKGYASSQPEPFARADDKKDLPQDATHVALTISGPIYNSTYDYDAATKLYARSQAGAPHNDREDGQITAKVVVAMRVNMRLVMEDGYRESIDTVGNGDAMIFQNGHAIKATWRKDSRESQLKFSDAAGQPISLARGTTWVTAVPNKGGDVTWQ